MTPAEKILWVELRDRKINNLKFRRQAPFVFGAYFYVADFYCSELKLIIEVDGGIHDELEIQENDQLREDIFRLAGFKILRFRNEEVINFLDDVVREIKERTLLSVPSPN